MDRPDVGDTTHILVDKKQPLRFGEEPVPNDTVLVYADCQPGRFHSYLRDKYLGVSLKDDLAWIGWGGKATLNVGWSLELQK